MSNEYHCGHKTSLGYDHCVGVAGIRASKVFCISAFHDPKLFPIHRRRFSEFEMGHSEILSVPQSTRIHRLLRYELS